MNKITFPLKQSMQGRQVANLQEALQSCLDRGALVANDDRTRRELVAALKLERPEQTYGAATKKLVRLFQEEKHLDTSGEVDQPTANALNALLKKWGLLEPTERSSSCVVSGAVQREDGLLLGGVHARAFHQTGRGAIRLGEDTTDAQGRYTIRYELLPGVDAINLGVSAVDEDGTTLGSSPVIKDASPLETIDLTVPLAAASADQERIEGTIMWEHGLPAEKLNLRLYRRDFGGKLTKLDDKITLAGGRYAFAYDVGSAVASLEVHARLMTPKSRCPDP
jgi:hypothetical protein